LTAVGADKSHIDSVRRVPLLFWYEFDHIEDLKTAVLSIKTHENRSKDGCVPAINWSSTWNRSVGMTYWRAPPEVAMTASQSDANQHSLSVDDCTVNLNGDLKIIIVGSLGTSKREQGQKDRFGAGNSRIGSGIGSGIVVLHRLALLGPITSRQVKHSYWPTGLVVGLMSDNLAEPS